MNRRLDHLTILSIVLLIVAGCAHAISRENQESALRDLTPESILRDFETYKGRLVLMGGEVIKTRNLKGETLIEVLQKPLSRSTDRPLENKDADGRFLVKYETFKDPYVFSQGREITIAGIVAGKDVSKIDHREYTYVVLQNRETHLWTERKEYYPGYPYGYPFGWYPYCPGWYPYHPWRYHPYYCPY